MSDKVRLVIPTNKRVLVRIQARQEKTKGGIIIPETSKNEAPTSGIVVRYAGDCYQRTKELFPKDTEVIFSKHVGVDVTVMSAESGDKSYQLLKEEDILGRIQEVDNEENL